MNNMQLPQEDVKYLGLHIDRRFTWHKHIFAKRKQLGITLTKMYFYSDASKNALQVTNFSYIKQYSNRTYRIQLWGTAFASKIDILERFQSKALRIVVDSLWCVPNSVIRRDLQIPTVKGEICHYSSHYSPRLSPRPNDLIVNLMELPDNRRLL
jgi:hypothetical protein